MTYHVIRTTRTTKQPRASWAIAIEVDHWLDGMRELVLEPKRFGSLAEARRVALEQEAQLNAPVRSQP